VQSNSVRVLCKAGAYFLGFIGDTDSGAGSKRRAPSYELIPLLFDSARQDVKESNELWLIKAIEEH
jgi:hypothetical protein